MSNPELLEQKGHALHDIIHLSTSALRGRLYLGRRLDFLHIFLPGNKITIFAAYVVTIKKNHSAEDK